MKFAVGEAWTARDGSTLTVVAVDAPGDQPIVAVWTYDGKTVVRCFSDNGRYSRDKPESQHDLVSKVEPLWSAKIWVNKDGRVISHQLYYDIWNKSSLAWWAERGWRLIDATEVRK